MARCLMSNCDPDEIEQAKSFLDDILALPISQSLEDVVCPKCGLIESCECLPQ